MMSLIQNILEIMSNILRKTSIVIKFLSFIPLNPPPIPMINNDGEGLNFARNFENATNYILFAAVACQRLRVNEEVIRRSKLRWFGVFTDLYDQYRSIVNTMPELINN